MAFRGGVKGALEMLNGLSISERQNILELIAKQDIKLAEVLQNGLVELEDIRFLNVNMIRDLLREINMDDLALAMRISSSDLKDHIYSNISSTMKRDLDDTLLGPPRPVSDIQAAQDRIIAKMKELSDKGVLIIDRSGNDPLV